MALIRLSVIAAAALLNPNGTHAFAHRSITISSVPKLARRASTFPRCRVIAVAGTCLGGNSATLSSPLTTMSATNNGDTTTIQQIGIIGGGAAGLAAARAFLSANSNKSHDVQFEVTILEARNAIGGIWKYEDETNEMSSSTSTSTTSTNGINNNSKKSRPMYRNLRTNLPKELMAFREYPWGNNDGSMASYVSHTGVQQYLEDYAKEFDLVKHFQYGCKVDHLKVLTNNNQHNENGSDTKKEGHENESECTAAWPQISLQWTDTTTNQSHSKTFDNVCICNGHYALPSSPTLPGLSDHFTGRVIHAIQYDDPNEFEGQTVLCVGARASGADIAREIGLVKGTRVYLSDSTCDTMKEYDTDVVLMPRTDSIDKDGVIHFAASGDGTKSWTAKDVDVIIFCSGYDYSFPFINEDSNVEIKSIPGERRVSPLYEQLWHAQYPSLSFIGLPHSVVPFPAFETQATAVVSQLTSKAGSIPLPSLSERLAAAETDANSGGPNSPGRVQDTHFLGSHQWNYCRKLSKLSGLYDTETENYIATNKALYDQSGKERKGMVPGGDDFYRETRFRRKDDEQTFEVLHSELPLESVNSVV